MPIKYKLKPLIDLLNPNYFDQNNLTQEDLTQMRKSLTDAIKEYSNSLYPKEKQIEVKYHRTKSYGFCPFCLIVYSFPEMSSITPQMKCIRVYVRHTSDRIISLSLMLFDERENKYFHTNEIGKSNEGELSEWHVPNGQVITGIELRYWMDIDGIVFITDRGVRSPMYGGEGGMLKKIDLIGSLIGMAGKRALTRSPLMEIQFISKQIF